ncbi:hypothetical protein [Tsuneonella mangrovi]|uniref:hypothetical protein n=1 Tax=Tsuneonella mangrovi TaxID=1982042 RepID=UPI001470FB5D|nr:hypothetical protein [Tsuneonella mangrovi]
MTIENEMSMAERAVAIRERLDRLLEGRSGPAAPSGRYDAHVTAMEEEALMAIFG